MTARFSLMRCIRVFVAGLTLSPLFGGGGTADGQYPRKMKALRPGDLGTLRTAQLDASIKEQIYTALLTDAVPPDRGIAGKASVFVVAVGQGPRLAIQVEFPSEWCGATGNCGVMIFDGKTGSTLLEGEDGFHFYYLKRMHHGVRDFVIRANMSCCEGTRHVYRFDGTEYKLYRDVREIYDEELGASRVKDVRR